jgi:hypothetical protein
VTQHEPSPSSASSSVNQTLCSWANFGSGWRRVNSFFPLKKNGEEVYKSVSLWLPCLERSHSIIFLYHTVSTWDLEGSNSLKPTYSSSFEESEFDKPPIDERQAVTMANGRCWPLGKPSPSDNEPCRGTLLCDRSRDTTSGRLVGAWSQTFGR